MSRTANDVEIGVANVVIKFRSLDPETHNVLIINTEAIAEIHMRHRRTTPSRVTEGGHVQVDVKLPPLPAGFAAELLAAGGAPGSGVLGGKYLFRRKLTIIWSN
jgi:hypothetical protein